MVTVSFSKSTSDQRSPSNSPRRRADELAESAGRGNDPHGTGVQLNMFDAPAGAQMSFFPSEAEQIQSIAEAESVTPSAFSMFISQDDIDHILRAGGNADAARMKITAEFSKQKPLENRTAFLKALYYGGNGLITDNGRLSAWYRGLCQDPRYLRCLSQGRVLQEISCRA